ncbi:MAG: DUF2238 domain-containing protein [Planctomycetes bacterium]|nr:DUF2238 domain-containing protein [Planctomycetota bacterium]
MLLTRREVPLLVANLIYVPVFTIIALRKHNYEFLMYVAVVLVIAAWILWQQRRVRFGRAILWGLTLWGLLHMAGGNIAVGDGVLYGVRLLPLSERHHILRYDQVVHMFGFGVATLVAHHLLSPHLRGGLRRGAMFWMLVALMGCGFGALNEVIEFVAVLSLPQTGVGGYENTLWDLVFNLLGSVLAASWLARRAANSALPAPER